MQSPANQTTDLALASLRFSRWQQLEVMQIGGLERGTPQELCFMQGADDLPRQREEPSRPGPESRCRDRCQIRVVTLHSLDRPFLRKVRTLALVFFEHVLQTDAELVT